MEKLIPSFDRDLRAEIKSALVLWVEALPRDEAEAMAITVSGIEYSPKSILNEVVEQTKFGNQFTEGLCELHNWMDRTVPGSSVIDLIFGSIKKFPDVHVTARKQNEDEPQDAIAREIGLAAGVIWRKLAAESESSEEELAEALQIRHPLVQWAIGWLAKENQISIRSGENLLSLEQQIGSAAGKIWHLVHEEREMSLSDLHQMSALTSPIFDWAIGWLAKEREITIEQRRGKYVIRQRQKAAAAHE